MNSLGCFAMSFRMESSTWYPSGSFTIKMKNMRAEELQLRDDNPFYQSYCYFKTADITSH